MVMAPTAFADSLPTCTPGQLFAYSTDYIGMNDSDPPKLLNNTPAQCFKYNTAISLTTSGQARDHYLPNSIITTGSDGNAQLGTTNQPGYALFKPVLPSNPPVSVNLCQNDVLTDDDQKTVQKYLYPQPIDAVTKNPIKGCIAYYCVNMPTGSVKMKGVTNASGGLLTPFTDHIRCKPCSLLSPGETSEIQQCASAKQAFDAEKDALKKANCIKNDFSFCDKFIASAPIPQAAPTASASPSAPTVPFAPAPTIPTGPGVVIVPVTQTDQGIVPISPNTDAASAPSSGITAIAVSAPATANAPASPTSEIPTVTPGTSIALSPQSPSKALAEPPTPTAPPAAPAPVSASFGPPQPSEPSSPEFNLSQRISDLGTQIRDQFIAWENASFGSVAQPPDTSFSSPAEPTPSVPSPQQPLTNDEMDSEMYRTVLSGGSVPADIAQNTQSAWNQVQRGFENLGPSTPTTGDMAGSVAVEQAITNRVDTVVQTVQGTWNNTLTAASNEFDAVSGRLAYLGQGIQDIWNSATAQTEPSGTGGVVVPVTVVPPESTPPASGLPDIGTPIDQAPVYPGQKPAVPSGSTDASAPQEEMLPPVPSKPAVPPLPAPSPTIDPEWAPSTLRNGSTGEDVTTLQEFLNAQADNGCINCTVPAGATGNYYTQTVNAVKAFQAWRGLPVDGVVGSATAACMRDLKQCPTE